MTQKVLIIGATRGLGVSLANLYALAKDTVVYGTTRSADVPKSSEKQRLETGIRWLRGIDVSEKDVGGRIVEGLKREGEEELDAVVSFFISFCSSSCEWDWRVIEGMGQGEDEERTCRVDAEL